MNVSVIILNWNGRHLLKRCLDALLAQDYPDFNTIIVDNGSEDGSPRWIARHYPHLTLIRNPTNRGFAAANNQAIRATTAPYIVTLNNDTEVEPGWLSALVSAAESDPGVGMCAPKILLAHPPHLIDSAGITVDWAGTAWNRDHGHPDTPGGTRPAEVFGPSGAAALYRRAMLDQIGLFDEDFFAYYEDVDLAWRAQLAGWRCLYVPTSRLYHIHSATLGRHAPHKQYLLSRNKIWSILKNYPAPAILTMLPLILSVDLMALLPPWRHSPRLGRSALRGRIDAWRALPLILQKRKQVQKLRRGPFPVWHRLTPIPLRGHLLSAGPPPHPSP